ncbi:hypothetical protein E2C01_011299 [Portunus trituberculatus]|uniref:Uncharacterized protein n=1 Tax=Portunus trituberculatus TaxID=210409 RepID=A0A5B7DBB2_PORTR|nr:hypothetical protein [Portunus trituberculatus]
MKWCVASVESSQREEGAPASSISGMLSLIIVFLARSMRVISCLPPLQDKQNKNHLPFYK